MLEKFDLYDRFVSLLFTYTTWKKILFETFFLTVFSAVVFTNFFSYELAVIASSCFFASGIVYVFSIGGDKSSEREVLIITNYQKAMIISSIVGSIVFVEISSVYMYGSYTVSWVICLFAGWYWFDKWNKGLRFFDSRLNFVNKYSKNNDLWESASVAFERAESYRRRDRYYMAYKWYEKSRSIYEDVKDKEESTTYVNVCKLYIQSCELFKESCKNSKDSSVREQFNSMAREKTDEARERLRTRRCSGCGGTFDAGSMYRELDDMAYEKGFYCESCYNDNFDYSQSRSSTSDSSGESSSATSSSSSDRIKDACDVLDINVSIDKLNEDIIKKAFREKVKIYHPDTSDKENAEEKFKQVKEAKEILMNYI